MVTGTVNRRSELGEGRDGNDQTLYDDEHVPPGA